MNKDEVLEYVIFWRITYKFWLKSMEGSYQFVNVDPEGR
jgi:hypothetical protein